MDIDYLLVMISSWSPSRGDNRRSTRKRGAIKDRSHLKFENKNYEFIKELKILDKHLIDSNINISRLFIQCTYFSYLSMLNT